MRAISTRLPLLLAVPVLLHVAPARAADPPSDPKGAPPPDAKALVAGQKAADAPTLDKGLDGTSASVSAGGLLATGNSRLLAVTLNGGYDTRFDGNGIGAWVLGNYGRGAASGKPVAVTAENIQGRLRYDRYLRDELAVFVLNTGRHDRFQGIDFRYNLDPGAKYLFLKQATNTLWVEFGYDLQHDIRRNGDRVVRDAAGAPTLNPAGGVVVLDKTRTDHSSRLFVGYKHSFNKEVTLSTGLEYLQSFVDTTRYRLNYDALVAAKVGGGLALGFGLSARYDHDPLPGKEGLDTATTASLIYAFSDVPEPPKPKTCPCPEEAPPPPPAAPPVPPPPATSPTTAPVAPPRPAPPSSSPTPTP